MVLASQKRKVCSGVVKVSKKTRKRGCKEVNGTATKASSKPIKTKLIKAKPKKQVQNPKPQSGNKRKASQHYSISGKKVKTSNRSTRKKQPVLNGKKRKGKQTGPKSTKRHKTSTKRQLKDVLSKAKESNKKSKVSKKKSKVPKETKEPSNAKKYENFNAQRALDIMNGLCGEKKNYSYAAQQTGVSASSCRRWKKAGYIKVADIGKAGFQCYLTPDQEQEVVEWVQDMAAKHLCVTLMQFTRKIDEILNSLNVKRRGEAVFTSRHYIDGFINRHDELKKKVSAGIEERRRKNSTPETVRSFFSFVEKFVKDHGIKLFINMDESGFSGEELKKMKFKVYTIYRL